ncbi:MAG: hypothetical protein KGR69_06475 [Verrucomicrobia bacterium]|nr:hypothetical protein [Verrucomicrobiota bacterium]
MLFRCLTALFPALLAILGQGDASRSAAVSAPIPADAIWDAKAWDADFGDSFWTKSTPSVVHLSAPRPDRRASDDAAARPTTPPRPFSSRQTGK